MDVCKSAYTHTHTPYPYLGKSQYYNVEHCTLQSSGSLLETLVYTPEKFLFYLPSFPQPFLLSHSQSGHEIVLINVLLL